jgi:predicted P-loop ATPase
MSGIHHFSEAMRRRNSPTGDWRSCLAKTEVGTPRKNLFNACGALRNHPELQGKIAYDEFRGTTWARASLPWDVRANRPWSEFDDLKATEWLQSPEIGILVSSAITREAVQAVAHENRFHPLTEWLESLQWDGEKRLSKWLTTYLGVPSSPLAAAMGRKFLISAVSRVMRPGCKADHMLILEGQQGILKSKSLHALVGDDWFADQIADLGTKDSCQDLRGVWIIELSEMSAIRPGEVERVKAYVSRQVDHYRPSYGRRSIDVPRQCVFIGTTNAHEYLSDSTGGRRFWPVTCTKIDIEGIVRDRIQIWAEAVVAYHAGETWWLDDDELRRLAEAEQELRRVEDPWESVIADWLDNPVTRPDREGFRSALTLDAGRLTIAQILEHAIAKPTERQSKSDQMRVGKVLKLLGWEKHHSNGKFWVLSRSGPGVD